MRYMLSNYMYTPLTISVTGLKPEVFIHVFNGLRSRVEHTHNNAILCLTDPHSQ